MSAKIFDIFRTKKWWNFILPPIISWVYFVIFVENISIKNGLITFFVVLTSTIGTAIFGFFLNDVTDFKEDIKSNKQNLTYKLNFNQKVLVFMFSLLVGILPWLIIKSKPSTFYLLGLQFLLLILYSLPPVRLKRHAIIAIVIDALYSGVLFVIIVISQFSSLTFSDIWAVIATYFIKGIRNIVLHQIDDYEHDLKANNSNICNYFSQRVIKNFLVGLTIVELLFIAVLCYYLSSILNPYIYISLPVFILYVYLNRLNSLFYRFNSFYEEILPLVFLIYLITLDYFFLIFLILHLILFRNYFIIFVYKNYIKAVFYWLYNFLYHRIILWLYYKAFYNRYIKKLKKLWQHKTD